MQKQPKPLPSPQVTAEPTFEKRTRRIFTANYKLKIITQADNCQHDELGELLRKERLYHSQLSEWRKEFGRNGCGP